MQVHDQPIEFEEFCLALSGRFDYVAEYGRWQQDIWNHVQHLAESASDYTLRFTRDVVYACPRELEDYEIRSLYLGGLRREYQSLRYNKTLKTFTLLREAAEAMDEPLPVRRSAVRDFPPGCGRTNYHHRESSQARPVAMEEDPKEEDSDEDPEEFPNEDP